MKVAGVPKTVMIQVFERRVLTYTPDKPDNEGGFHKVVVTANNKDWSVSAREGYYAPQK